MDQQPFASYELDEESDQFSTYMAIRQCLLENDADPASVILNTDSTIFDTIVKESHRVEPRAAHAI